MSMYPVKVLFHVHQISPYISISHRFLLVILITIVLSLCSVGMRTRAHALLVCMLSLSLLSHRADFYGPKGSYGLFAGRDASRALAKSSLDKADVENSSVEVRVIALHPRARSHTHT